MRTQFIVAMGAVVALNSACATTDSAVPQTAMQRAQGQCVAALVVGTLAGAIIGNNTGSGNARAGATRGAVAGGVVCAVLMAMASEEDKRRIREAEYAAAETGQRREEVYVGPDGRKRTILVETQSAPDKTWTFTPSAADSAVPASAVQQTSTDICRLRQTHLTVEGTGTGSLPQELICRNPQTRAWEVQAAAG